MAKDKNKNKGNKSLKDALGSKAPVVDKEVVAPVKEAAAPKAAPVKENKEVVSDEKATASPNVTPVKDDNGRVLFRRVVGGTPENIRSKAAPAAVGRKKPTRLGRSASVGSPTSLKFPTDRWGVTKDVKEAFYHLASRIGGDPRKKELADEVLAILMKYLDTKFDVDAAIRQKRADQARAAAEAKALVDEGVGEEQ